MKALVLFLVLISSICSKDFRKIEFHNKPQSTHDVQPSRNLDDSGFSSCLLFDNLAVHIDKDYETKNNNLNASKEIFLAISLWSNESGFSIPSENLAGIHNYVCDVVGCIEDNSTVEFNSPWIQTNIAKRVHLNKTISIAGGAWQLKTSALSLDFETFAMIADKAPYGFIGLGTGAGANRNFRNENPIFSILINQTKYGIGSLIFGFDSSIANIDHPLVVVNSDANWKMQMVSLSFDSVIHFDANKPLPMMLDLKIRGILLPKKILAHLHSKMKTYGLKCNYYECSTGNLTGLPPLVFGFADSRNIFLRPEDYMKHIEYKLMFEEDLYTSLLFRPTEILVYYEDHVILGWDVLANFYTLFQQINGVNTISFYEIDSATPQSPPIDVSELSLTWVLTGVIFMIALVFVVIVIVLFTTKKNRPNTETETETETTELGQIESSSIFVDPQEQNHLL